MAKRLGTFKKILAETLLLSSHKVTKWSWRGRTSLFTLACFARQCGGGTDNQRGSSRTVLHEGEWKRRVNGKGTKEKEDYLYVT